MRYSYKKIAIYNNVKVLCDNAKSAFYLFKIPRVRIDFTRIYLIAAHVTLAYAIFSSKRTARLRKRKASYSDRLVSNLRSHNIEKNVRNRVFANKIDKKG
jgi:hypothetical protein